MLKFEIIQLRASLDDEIREVKRLIDRVIDECYVDYYVLEVRRFFKEYHSLDEIQKRVTEGYTIVYKLNGRIVGCGSLVDNYISSVYVERNNQGYGIGKIIVENLMAQARKLKLEMLTLDSTPGARTFYLQIGCKEIDECTQWIDEIYPLDYYVMEKVL